jgi:DNA-binding MarR family transcriptional regulator
MTNLFLKINKDLFKLGLNPTELIILAQIMEYDTNNKVCYMTNEQFAEMLNVSAKTVSRAINDTL